MSNDKYLFDYKWTEQQFFKYACFVDDLQLFYRQWIDQKRDRMQFFTERNGKLEHNYWIPSKICRESGEELSEENTTILIGYWFPFCWFPIRKDLLEVSKKFEQLECQKIDCSCNDCKFFERIKERNGNCIKKGIPIIAQPNTSCPNNLECFEHRRS